MSRLSLEQLRVTTFVASPETRAAEALYTEYNPVCYSPYCVPTLRTCRCVHDEAPRAARGA